MKLRKKLRTLDYTASERFRRCGYVWSFFIVLLVSCQSSGFGTPKAIVHLTRHDTNMSFNTSSFSGGGYDYDDDDGGSQNEDSFSSSTVTSFDVDPYWEFGVSVEIPFSVPDKSQEVDYSREIEERIQASLEDVHEEIAVLVEHVHEERIQEERDLPWYRDLLTWTLEVHPLILGMIIIALTIVVSGIAIICFIFRDRIKQYIPLLRDKKKKDGD